MVHLRKALEHERLSPTLVLGSIVLLATWMGAVNGGYDVGQWALVALILAMLVLITSVVGMFGRIGSRSGIVALSLFGAYTVWTFASLIWAPNQGNAWLGAGQTMLYLLAFWLALGLLGLGPSGGWVLPASAMGPTVAAALTLPMLISRMRELFV